MATNVSLFSGSFTRTDTLLLSVGALGTVVGAIVAKIAYTNFSAYSQLMRDNSTYEARTKTLTNEEGEELNPDSEEYGSALNKWYGERKAVNENSRYPLTRNQIIGGTVASVLAVAAGLFPILKRI